MKIKTNKKMPARRSVAAISLRNFRSTIFHHKAEVRGGSVNGFSDLLDEVSEDREVQEELNLLDGEAE